jgi:transposase
MDKRDEIIREQSLIIEKLKEELKRAYAEIEELKRRLGLNSSNSSKPPASDGLRKKRTASGRRKNPEKFGGQTGHTGKTLEQVEKPDEVVEHNEVKCKKCDTSLDGVNTTKTIKRQVHDIIIKKVVTEHVSSVKVCPCCNEENVGDFPENVNAPAQYGPNVRATAVYLAQQFLPKDRLQQTMNDIFGVDISDTTLMKYDRECAENLAPFMEQVAEATKSAPVKGADETGMRIDNQTQWLHVLCTALLTYYRVNSKRGNVLEDITGTVVHDHWTSYLKLPNASHAFCNAHHLRELQAVHELDLESWADKMRKLLLFARQTTTPTQQEIQSIELQYDQIIQEGLTYHDKLGPPYPGKRKKRTGHNLLLRLQKFKNETLRFLHDPRVPFTNNMSERDLRMMKLHQKVSGCFRTPEGAQTFVRIRSLISTSRKQGVNVMQSLRSVTQNKFSAHNSAGINF